MGSWWRRRAPSGPLTAVLLPPGLREQVVGAARQDGEVAAVRLVRERTGLGLLPAVLAVRAAVAAADA